MNSHGNVIFMSNVEIPQELREEEIVTQMMDEEMQRNSQD